jgi:hypothetical protein
VGKKGFMVIGWITLTLSYFLTYGLSSILYRMIFTAPADHDWNTSGVFMGIFMLTIPYLIAGLFVRISPTTKKIKLALWIGLIPCIFEKILLLWIGSLFVNSNNPSIGADTSIAFLRGDGGLPYFSVTYMLLGLISVFLCIYIANYRKPLIRVHK